MNLEKLNIEVEVRDDVDDDDDDEEDGDDDDVVVVVTVTHSVMARHGRHISFHTTSHGPSWPSGPVLAVIREGRLELTLSSSFLSLSVLGVVETKWLSSESKTPWSPQEPSFINHCM